MRYMIFLSILLLLLIYSSTSIIVARGILEVWIKNTPSLILLSLAAGLVISCGQIDISSGALLSFLGMTMVAWVNCTIPGNNCYISALNVFFYISGSFYAEVGALLILVFSCVIYLLVGGVISYLKIPSLLCTLGFLFIGQGSSILIQSIFKGIATFEDRINIGKSLQVPLAIRPDQMVSAFAFPWAWVWLCSVISILFLWKRTYAGLSHIAVGLNTESARIAGIKPRSVYLCAFLMTGILVGLATHIHLFGINGGAWEAQIGWGRELWAIAAAVIGGCRLSGGRFDPIAITLAACVIYALYDFVLSLQLPSELSYVLFGLILVMYAIFDKYSHNLLYIMRLEESPSTPHPS